MTATGSVSRLQSSVVGGWLNMASFPLCGGGGRRVAFRLPDQVKSWVRSFRTDRPKLG